MRAETLLQRQIRKYLALHGFRSVACSNGAVLAGNAKQRAIQMNTLKSAGLTPGYPDLIVYGPGGRIGHIEVKLEGEPLEPKQVEVHGWLTEWGHLVVTCRSVQDVDETLARWGWIG